MIKFINISDFAQHLFDDPKQVKFDREFSYQVLLRALVTEKIHFVIRLNLGSQLPTLIDEDGRAIQLRIMPGKKVIYRNLWYIGKVKANIIGVWRKGFSAPLWVMTDLKPEAGLRIYRCPQR